MAAISSPVLDVSFICSIRGRYLPIRSDTLKLAINTSTYLNCEMEAITAHLDDVFKTSSNQLDIINKYKQSRIATKNPSCAIQCLPPETLGKSTVSAHRPGTCPERSPCSHAATACCSTVPPHHLPQPDQIDENSPSRGCIFQLKQDFSVSHVGTNGFGRLLMPPAARSAVTV